ncbi:transglutaminase family protein [Belliella sp. DSM 107340]|uniref:Transglutaminase family protein n=1 Tax=Belliella calami TaxID=2923436 RepID=A0ABS9UNB1_9BACT|nr:transglutaminase family protein [Belliella calami]MCH7398111.1 transglutaminase family protein [Belliella calami]
MILLVDHLSKYSYDEKVSLNPHSLLLIPQQRSYIKILESELLIAPNPMGKNERINAEGNSYFQVWFNETTASLQVQSKLKLEITAFNPYGFILQSGLVYPFDYFGYPEELLPALHLFRQVEDDHDELLTCINNAKSVSGDHISFLAALVADVHKDWKHIIREEEGLMTLQEMFDMKEGSCRDLSWLLIQMLRKVGMAARFVSGYAFNPELAEGHELHAWVEVFLPGAGWVGLDPSLGLLSDQNYIPLACSYHPLNTLPIYGTYGGKGKSRLFSEVIIKQLE